MSHDVALRLQAWLSKWFRGAPGDDDYTLARDLAHALVRDKWVTALPKERFEMAVIPLDQRNGGMYEVKDTVNGDVVAMFHRVWDAVAFVNNLNAMGRESDKVKYRTAVADVPTSSTGVAR